MAIKPKYIVNKSIIATKEFTDRDEFLVAFNRALNREDLEENKILVYYGVGGIGKSSLINKICMNIDNNVEYAILDVNEGNNRIAENGLYSLKKSFNKKINFQLFDLAYAIYWKKCHPNMAINEKTFPYLEESSVILDLISTLGDLPVVSILPNIITAAEKVSKKLINYYSSVKNEINLIEKMSVSELEEKLPYYWANDFNKSIINSKSKYVIFIDTYEAIWEDDRTEGAFFKKDEWIRNLASCLPNVLFVICGREKLRWSEENPEWEEYIEQHLIGSLSDIDAKKFLSSSNIKEEELQNAIIDGSDGIPYYLDLAVDTYNSMKRDNKQCLPKDFEGAPKEIFYRFIKHLTTAEVETLKVLAIPRYFDFDIFSMLVKEFNTGYPVTGFYQLCNFSFITERENGEIYEMQKLIKNTLENYQNCNLIPKINMVIADYYEKKLLDIKDNLDIELIKNNILEYYYHAFRAYQLNEFAEKIKPQIELLRELGQYNIIINLLESLLEMENYKSLNLTYLKYFTNVLVDSFILVGKNNKAEIYIIKIIEYLDIGNYDEYEKVEFLEKKINVDKELYGVERSIDTCKILCNFFNENKELASYKQDFNDRKVNLLIALGKLHIFIREIDKAKEFYEEAICICDYLVKSKENFEKLGLLNERLGEIYSEYLNDFNTANNYYTIAISNYEKALSEEESSNYVLLLNMGLAYKRIGENNLIFNNIDISIDNCRKAIEIYDSVIESSPEIIDSYIKKGFAYIDWLKVLVNNKNYRYLCDEFFDNGVKAFEKALEFVPYNRSVLTGLNGAYRAYGILNFNENKKEQAIDNLLKAIDYGTKSLEYIKDHPYSYNSRAKSYTALAEIYGDMNDKILALQYYNNAINDYESILEISQDIEYATKRINELSEIISKL